MSVQSQVDTFSDKTLDVARTKNKQARTVVQYFYPYKPTQSEANTEIAYFFWYITCIILLLLDRLSPFICQIKELTVSVLCIIKKHLF